MFSRRAGQSTPCPTVSQAFDPKGNAFAFLRMVLALFVIFSHSFALGGFGTDPLSRITEGHHSFGEVGVALFFLLSGFLIARSSLQCGSVGRFLWHRFLRIFPAYWVCLLVMAFLFSPLFELAKQGVFSPESAVAYVRGNWTMFHLNGFSIPGIMSPSPMRIGSVLDTNPYRGSINGSLWSLPFECACYLVLALFAVVGFLRRGRFGLVTLFGILWALYAFSCLDAKSFAACFPYQCFQPPILFGLYFSAGCVAYLYRDCIPVSKSLFVAALILLAVGLVFGSFGLVAPIAMSYASLCIAFWLPIRNFDAVGDFSYGTYIYAFPVQQGLVLLGVHQNGFTVFLTWTLLVTLIFAVLSWRWVERPCLKWKHVKFFRIKNASANLPMTAPDEVLILAAEPARLGCQTSLRR